MASKLTIVNDFDIDGLVRIVGFTLHSFCLRYGGDFVFALIPDCDVEALYERYIDMADDEYAHGELNDYIDLPWVPLATGATIDRALAALRSKMNALAKDQVSYQDWLALCNMATRALENGDRGNVAILSWRGLTTLDMLKKLREDAGTPVGG